MLPTRIDDVGGKRVRFYRGGSGPTIVFLHGYPDNLQQWSGVAPLLPDFDVIAFDWPGMGGSEAWAGGATPFAMADRLVALLDHWRVDRAAIVGIDMGGQPAVVAAARHPDRVSHLIVTGSLLKWNVRTSWEIALLRRYRFNQFALRYLPRIVFHRAIGHIPRDVRDDFWTYFRRRSVRDFIIRMCAGYQGTLPRLLDEAINVPTLSLWGANDRHFPPEHAIGSVKIVESGRHWLPLQMPSLFATEIKSFTTEAQRTQRVHPRIADKSSGSSAEEKK